MSAESEGPRRRVLVSLMICLFVVGFASCAAKIDPELKRRAEAIPVLTASQIEGRPHEVVGEVKGRGCISHDHEESLYYGLFGCDCADRALSEAWLKMQIAAVEIHAEAIIRASCEAKWEWPSLSFSLPACGAERVYCQGLAVQWPSEEVAVAAGWQWPP